MISNLFDSIDLDLPETNLANQKKAIPFLIQDSLLDDVVDTYRDLTTFNTPLGELSITPGLKSFEAKLSFKKGGLLDRSRKK